MQRLRAYKVLCKPGILTMVLVTTATGFFLGSRGFLSYTTLFFTLVGTAASCAGAAILNNFLECDVDAHMKRTAKRPIPTGEIAPNEALLSGIILVLGGTFILLWKINVITAFLAILSAFLYVLVYTPLKRVTWLNTLVGAIPGALPPMGGWTAATGQVEAGAWVLFAILFLWQQPHFYSIAWIFREDYKRAGFKMLPVVDPDGASTFRQAIIYSALLIPVSILPTWLGLSGYIYLVGVCLLGLWMLYYGILLSRSHSILHAKRLLHASIFYLPLWFVLIITDVKF